MAAGPWYRLILTPKGQGQRVMKRAAGVVMYANTTAQVVRFVLCLAYIQVTNDNCDK